MKKKVLVFMMLALLAFAAPAFAKNIPDGGIEIIPGNGGEGEVTTPAEPFPGNEQTTPDDPETPVVPNNGITVSVDGMTLTPDVAPYVDRNSRTQAPFRAIGEALDCQVTWVADARKVVVEKPGFNVEMVIGEKTFAVNGETVTMDTAPVITKSRTFIPVRYLGEALDCQVLWIDDTKTVEITSK